MLNITHAELITSEEVIIPKGAKCTSGTYGSYYQVSDHSGIKVLDRQAKGHAERMDLCGIFSKSPEWETAVAEFNLIKCLGRTHPDLVPETYAVKPVCKNKLWYAGLVVEHISGRVVWDINWREISPQSKHKWKGIEHVLEYVRKALLKSDIAASDIHGGNIMIVLEDGPEGKNIVGVKLIDFTKDYTNRAFV